MPPDYTLIDLAKLAGVTPRTVRYYIGQGLLPPPAQAGPKARYAEEHLERLRAIRRLQAGHLPLSEIRTRLRTTTDIDLAALADRTVEVPPATSAVDYIRELLGGRPQPNVAPPPLPAAPAPATVGPPLAAEQPERAQWERIVLDPDIELHIRRPLTRLQNKRVERIISIARQLLEED